jgi:iron complex outermembrane receptor protein
MKHFFTLILSFFVIIAYGQQPGFRISGVVNDKSDNTPVELAAVILKTADSAYVMDVLVDKNGKFILQKVNSGNYYLEVNFLSYKKYYSSKFDVKQNLDLGVILLEKNTTNVKEVNVTAIKNAVEFKAGKTVYNVGRDQTNAGLNGLEVLKKIPGVFVDNNDNISVRGKSGIRVYIDDRPSAMAAESPADAIKFFPAGSIESIEVITNPSARYDAAGAAAIINIHLKKEKKLGVNGSVNAGAGSQYEFSGINKMNLGGNANLRRNKTNAFLNANTRQDGRYTFNENTRELGSGQSVNSAVKGNNTSFNAFGKGGVDYFINDKHSFGVSLLTGFNGFNSKNESNAKSNAIIYPSSKTLSLSDAAFNSNTLNLNYLWKTKHAGEEISFDITHSVYNRKNLDSIENTIFLASPLIENQYSRVKGRVLSNSSQADYTRTLKGDAKMEAGLKNSYTTNSSNFDFYNRLEQSWYFDSARSNRFSYYENISAAYGDYSNKYKKVEYELGLRAEYTMVNSNITDVKQNYANLFPSAQFTRKFEEQRELSFSYSRRIERPSFNELSNSVSYADKYVGQRGNPKLKPEINNIFSLDFQKAGFESEKNLKWSAIGASVFGSLDKNLTGYLVVVDTGGVTYTTFTNVPHTYSYGVNTFGQFSYSRWYKGTVNLSANYQYISEASNGLLYNVYMQHTFKFLKKHSIDINGFYFSRFLTSQGYLKGTYQVNMGYKYVFNKENCILSFNVYDIFKTGIYRYYVTAGGYNLHGVFQFESRFANLSFTYKFSHGWQGDGKKRTRKNTNDSRVDFNSGGGLGTGK